MPILLGAGIFSRKMLRPDKFVKLLVSATRIAWTLRNGKAWVISDVERQYGSFQLYSYSLQRKDGTMRRQPYVMVVVGALATPTVIPLSQTYTAFGDTQGAVYLGNMPVAHIEPHDVYRYVQQWQMSQDEARAQRDKPFAPKGLDRLPPETQERIHGQAEARFREENVRAEARKTIVDEALHDFEARWLQ